ncbi:MAG: hypothetical protein HY558_00785 [Euryarchaeota archaeon]|nr:hypothetical protein [Euryarchaeota archaeon]
MVKLPTVLGFLLGLLFGPSLITFILSWVGSGVSKWSESVGSGQTSTIGLVLFIVITVVLLLKLKMVMALLTGIILGVAAGAVLRFLNIDLVGQGLRAIGL